MDRASAETPNVATVIAEEAPPPDEAPVVSVIVPVFNAAGTLGTQLEALARQAFDGTWEVVVADNGSTDRSLEVARGFVDRLPLRIVAAGEVRGAGHARNVGARAARAPLLAFVDADDEVAPGWLAAMVDALGRHAVVASRFDKERLNPPELRSTRRLVQERGLGAHDYAAFLPHAGGSGLAVRRSAHEAIGGFDERFLRLQDTDYCWRLQLDGHAIHFEPAALLHVRFRTATAAIRQAFDYGRFDGMLYRRYRGRGMAAVPLSRDLRRIVALVVKLPFRPRGLARTKQLRTLANRCGIVIGRLWGA